MPPKRDDGPQNMSRRQLFAKLVPPGVKELAEKNRPQTEDAKQREAAQQAEAALMERRVALARDGNVALAAGNLEEAVRHFRTFVKEAPQEALPRLCLGRCLYDLGQYIQARVEFQRALALTENGPAHQRDHAILFLGLCFLRLGKFWKAHDLWHAWHPQGVPALGEALDSVLPGIKSLAETAPGAELAMPSHTDTPGEAGASGGEHPDQPMTAAVESAIAKTPWAHLPPMIPNLPPVQA